MKLPDGREGTIVERGLAGFPGDCLVEITDESGKGIDFPTIPARDLVLLARSPDPIPPLNRCPTCRRTDAETPRRKVQTFCPDSFHDPASPNPLPAKEREPFTVFVCPACEWAATTGAPWDRCPNCHSPDSPPAVEVAPVSLVIEDNKNWMRDLRAECKRANDAEAERDQLAALGDELTRLLDPLTPETPFAREAVSRWHNLHPDHQPDDRGERANGD